MANIITAGNSTNGGTQITTDTSGTLNIVTGSGSGSNAITIDTSQNVSIPKGVGGTPAFSAYIGTTQSVTSGTTTKIAFDTEEFDTNSCYDTSTYRFTPNVAGYYQVNLIAYMATNAAGTSGNLYIYKNGGAITRLNLFYTSGSTTLYGSPSLSILVYMNGSTDYIEAYGAITATTPSFANTSSISKFSACLVRGA